MLRRYGFIAVTRDGESLSERFGPGRDVELIVAGERDAPPGLSITPEPAGTFLFEPRQWSLLPKRRAYRALLPHVSFAGSNLEPIWTAASGRTVVGWWRRDSRRALLVGLDLVEELVRYTQGDPAKVHTAVDKTLWGMGHERPAYLFEDNIVRGNEMVPWADRLGFVIARSLSGATGLPLLSPLPDGARGAVLLTGDDDQAELEKYEAQQRRLNGFPITYMLLPHTRHSRETLAAMPSTVEFGVHVDALDHQDRYAEICAEQTRQVRDLTRRPAHCVRNHGHLNQGYWTQLDAWEHSGLTLDFHIRGLDGTCPTGSYLPFRVRRPDGMWSGHWSVFSTFSDSMLFLQKWSEAKQIAVIRSLARTFSYAAPGIIVANFHPQNVEHIPRVHDAIVRLGRQAGWVALGAESFAGWLAATADLQLSSGGTLQAPGDSPIDRVALLWPGAPAPVRVPPFRGSTAVVRPS